MKSEICSAFLTPDFPASALGRVHSVFTRTANVELYHNGETRLLTLIPRQLPRLPDSIRIPEEIFALIRESMPAELNESSLFIGNLQLQYKKHGGFDGKIVDVSERIKPYLAAELLSASETLACGLDRLPEDYRKKVTDALRKGELNRYIGLGSGLTPSYDDACVGYMAVCSALGLPNKLVIDENTDTTDVSLRYLKLAQKGYFGEPLCRVINSLIGEDDIHSSLEELKAVGASSGCDMIYGLRIALNTLYLKE